MALQAANMADLLVATLADLDEMKFDTIDPDLLQEYIAVKTLLKKNRVTLDSGTSIKFRVMTTTSGSFQFVGLYATDVANVGDTLVEADHPWRHWTCNYSIDMREFAMNRSPRKLVDLLKERRLDAMIDQTKGMETAFWSFPASTDTTTAHGIAYWCVKNASEGFNGTVQSGYTTVAGLNPSTYTGWKNYTGQYTSMTKTDAIRMWRKAARKTAWKPPADGIPTFNTGNTYGFYTNLDAIIAMEELLEAQNENLGNDLASKDGQVTFLRTPVIWAPKLDGDSTNPIYGINWGVFKTYILRGFWMKEMSIEANANQHTVSTVHIDSSGNWVCKDRRRLFVLATGTSTP